jgi:hypothetical protein
MPLWDILELNETKRTVRVQPGVNVGQLSRFLTSKGYIIPVVPEVGPSSKAFRLTSCRVVNMDGSHVVLC